MFHNIKTPLATALSVSLLSCPVFAQGQEEQIETIIVRGALSETPLSQMASSISVLTDQDIDQRQAQHLEDLLNRAANVNFASGASRGRFIQIRGIGERSQFVDPINPSVGFLVDGINYSGLVAGASTFDVEQIEIFKGPNSARFGADGLAGMINVISKDTSADKSFAAQLGAANYGSWNMGAAVGGAMSDSLNYRMSVHKNSSDGFITNTWLNRDDTNNIDELTARAKFDWQATDDLNLRAVIHLIDVDNGYDAFSLNRDRTTLSDEPGFDRQKSEAVAFIADYQGWSWANMKIQYSNLQADLGYGYDEDWSYVGIAPGWEYSSTDHYFRERSDQSLEAKLLSKPGIANSWVVGVYYADKDEDLNREFFDFVVWAEDEFQSEVERTDLAVFGQYKHVLSDSQWLTGSLRLGSQQLDYADSKQIIRNVDDNDWGAELSFHQQASQNSFIYLSLQRSYKMGGVNGSALGKLDSPDLAELRDLLLDNATFDGESLVGIEFGIKGSNADASLTVDVNTFYQHRDNIQYKSWFFKNKAFVGLYDNATEGTNYGIEAALNYQISDNLHGFANLGWLKTKIDGVSRQDGSIIDNREQAHAPKYQVNVGINVNFSDSLSWLVEVDAKDDFYYSFTHDQRSDKMLLAHTSVDYQAGNWKISLYARNLFDEQYANRGFYFGNDPRDEYATHTYEQFGEPRRVGVNINYQY